jgi:hypothetical protein
MLLHQKSLYSIEMGKILLKQLNSEVLDTQEKKWIASSNKWPHTQRGSSFKYTLYKSALRPLHPGGHGGGAP